MVDIDHNFNINHATNFQRILHNFLTDSSDQAYEQKGSNHFRFKFIVLRVFQLIKLITSKWHYTLKNNKHWLVN